MLQPVIKWSGSKRSQAASIINNLRNVDIDTYYEPFVGGGSILGALLYDGSFNIKHYQISDLNETLIELWNVIKYNPKEVAHHYKCLWESMKALLSLDDKKVFYNNVRDRLNMFKDPLDFMFIMRTCVNGMPRYNRNGDFNTSLHLNRDGILPDKLEHIIMEWSYLLNKYDVTFTNRCYSKTDINECDFIYLDPPYANTKGMYYDNFSVDAFFTWLGQQNCSYVLSFDGISGDTDNTFKVPSHIYTEHLLIDSGNSSFKRIMTDTKDAHVKESLYVNLKEK